MAGLPRSGSTVLGQILGGLPDAIFVGELALFWRRFAEGELCSCGRILPDCPFWSAVVGKAFGPMTREQARELNKLERRVVRRQWGLGLTPVSWSTRWSTGINVMLEERTSLNRSILEVANVKWIIDSGKDVIFGAIESRIESTNFSTVHLVRDPRGVAFSWLKQVRSDSEPRDLPRSSAAKTSVRWISCNLLVQFLLNRLSGGYLRVRYEDLVAYPDDIVRKISNATLNVSEINRPTEQRVRQTIEHHVVGSNPGVRRDLGSDLQLKLDEEWRTQLPQSQRWLVTAVCGGLMAAYKYPLRK